MKDKNLYIAAFVAALIHFIIIPLVIMFFWNMVLVPIIPAVVAVINFWQSLAISLTIQFLKR
jgi:hypothetical protein